MKSAAGVVLVREKPEDWEFVVRLYSSTRMDELAVVNWTEEEKEGFLRSQCTAQHRYYVENYPNAVFDIIRLDELPVGRLYVSRSENEIRLMDIAVLPEHRNRGIGSLLIHRLMDEGRTTGRALGIHVEKFNPAQNLYRRLGFKPKEDKGVYLYMVWQPDAV